MSAPTVSPYSLIWRKFSQPSASLRLVLGGLATVAGLTLLAKAISFGKDAAVALWFGVSQELDTFVLAFGLLTFLASTLANGLPAALLPVFAEVRHRLGDAPADRLAVQSALIHLLSLLTLAGVVTLSSGPIVAVMGKGFTPEAQAVSKTILFDLLPFFICYGMTAHLSTWLRARKLFVAATASQMAIPITIVATLFFVRDTPSIRLLVLATNAGAAVHLVILLLALGRQLPQRKSGWWSSLGTWEVDNAAILRQTGPFLLAGIILGASTVIDQAMAGWLEEGSVTVLSYSEKVCGIVLALTAMTASDTLFPFFADTVAKKDWRRLQGQMKKIIAIALLVCGPVALIMAWQAPLLVKILFERGQFTPEATTRVSEVVRYAALQIPFYVIGVVLSRIVVSLQASKFTLIFSVISVVLNIVLNLVFMRTMGVAGIALSTTLVCVFLATIITTFVFKVTANRIAQEAIPG